MNPTAKYLLLIFCSFLVMALTACNFSLSDVGFVGPQAQISTDEAEWESIVATRDVLCASLTEEECDSLSIEQSVPTLGATEQALATARVVATATRAYFETKEALCTNLTPEECANAGSYWYTEAIVSNSADCTVPQSQGQISHTFSFEEGKVLYNRFISGSVADYTGHTRIATNTYQFTWPGGFPVNTLTFLQNGVVEEHILSEVCIFTYTYTSVD